MAKTFPPEKVFRALIIFCLLVMGGAMITVSRYPGEHTASLDATRELIAYSFLALLLYIFFYLQYVGVSQYLKHELSPTMGYAQAVVSLVFLLIGASKMLSRGDVLDPQVTSGMNTYGYMRVVGLLGETVFIFNIVWVYLRQQPKLKTPSALAKELAQPPVVPPAPQSALRWGWPNSPIAMFGISAAFFAIGGVLSLIADFPSVKLPIPVMGQIRIVSFGYLWLIGAAPFALFLLGYWLYVRRSASVKFDDRGTRLHFLLTFVAAFDAMRVPLAWQSFNAMRLPEAYIQHDTYEIGVLLAAASLAFAVNIYLSHRLSAAKSLVAARRIANSF